MEPMRFSLPATFETYQGLGNFMFEQGIEREMYEVVDEAINAWMSAFRKSKDQRSARTIDGYQWKDVFLPDGTILRNVYKGTSYQAHVEGRKLVFDGQEVSPAQFVNAVGGRFRNAWRTIWIRFPHDEAWKPAITLRKKFEQFKSE